MNAAPAAAHVAAILNAAYFVRLYHRPAQRELRARALEQLGRAVRDALNATDDFEPYLTAVIDGLSPRQRDF